MGSASDNKPLNGPVIFIACGDVGFVVEKALISAADKKSDDVNGPIAL